MQNVPFSRFAIDARAQKTIIEKRTHEKPVLDNPGDAMNTPVEHETNKAEAKSEFRPAPESGTELFERYLYIVTHDLRSPLVNIEGFSREIEHSVETLRLLLKEGAPLSLENRDRLREQLEDEIPSSLDFIFKSIRQMESLLGGLHEISRLLRHPVNPVELDMNRLVERAEAVCRKRPGIPDAVLSMEPLPSCRADEKLTLTLAEALIDNAFCYLAPDRPGEIHVSGETAKSLCRYRIRDNGIGIAPEHLEKVFEPFKRLGLKKGVPGSGLGLARARHIVKRLDGRITLDSRPGRGTIVTFELPRI
jgi:signal transduction histidine kinase